MQSALNEEATNAKLHHKPTLNFGLQQDLGYVCLQS